jgi:hypothetical protein
VKQTGHFPVVSRRLLSGRIFLTEHGKRLLQWVGCSFRWLNIREVVMKPLADLFGAGVQAAYRGPRLYDTPATLELVKKWVDFYKKHRVILDSDIIHIKRADGRDIDAILHVNPSSNEKGLLMIYNPMNHPVTQSLKVNIYYTGLAGKVTITDSKGKTGRFKIDRNSNVSIPVTVEPNSESWYILR